MNGEEDVINTDQIMLPSNEPQNWIWKRYVHNVGSNVHGLVINTEMQSKKKKV